MVRTHRENSRFVSRAGSEGPRKDPHGIPQRNLDSRLTGGCGTRHPRASDLFRSPRAARRLAVSDLHFDLLCSPLPALSCARPAFRTERLAAVVVELSCYREPAGRDCHGASPVYVSIRESALWRVWPAAGGCFCEELLGGSGLGLSRN